MKAFENCTLVILKVHSAHHQKGRHAHFDPPFDLENLQLGYVKLNEPKRLLANHRFCRSSRHCQWFGRTQ